MNPALDFLAPLYADGLDRSLRPWPIFGDMMAPTLKRGDMLLCRPVDRFDGEGVYVMGGGGVFRADRYRSDSIRLTSDNERYSEHRVSLDYFNNNVLARAEYAINSLGGQPLPGVFEAARYDVRSWT